MEKKVEREPDTATEPTGRRETYVDYLVRKAKADGAFENLPGAGKPIPDLDEPYDESWWARKLVERENLKQLFRDEARGRVKDEG